MKQNPSDHIFEPFWRTGGGITATERAAAYGIDVSMILENLRLTPEQRIDRNQSAINLVKELQQESR